MSKKPSGNVIADLAMCENLEALYALFNEEILRLGFDFYSMAIVPLDPKFEKAPLLHGTFPQAYIDGYQSLGAHLIDPYLDIIAKRTTPVFHSDVLPQFQSTDVGRKLAVLAEDSGVQQGYMVPLPTAGVARGVGYWAGTINPDFETTVRAHEAYLVFLATCFAAAAEDLGFAPQIVKTANLTDREKSILGLCAEGFNNTAIADHLAISERTVRFHLGNAYRKLGASGRAQALTRAIRIGLIETSNPGLSDDGENNPVFLP